MGFLRGTTVLTLTLLLFIAFFFSNLFLVLNWSLNYNHVEPSLKNITVESAQTSGEMSLLIKSYQSKKNFCAVSNQVNFTFEKNEFTVPCSVISDGEKTTVDYLVNKTVPLIYYKNYTCAFLDCLKNENQRYFLLSKSSMDYWGKNFQTSILISLGIFLLLLLFAKGKHLPFIISGVALIVSVIPLTQINWLLSFLSGLFPFKVLPAFFTSSSQVFTLSLIIGIILIALGVGFNLFKWGEIIARKINFISRRGEQEKPKNKTEDKTVAKEEIKNIVKEEIEEEIKKENKKPRKSRKTNK